MKNKNAILRAAMVQSIVLQHYEPERHDRSKRWCFHNFVNKVLPMSERTFWRYVNWHGENENNRQLSIF